MRTVHCPLTVYAGYTPGTATLTARSGATGAELTVVVRSPKPLSQQRRAQQRREASRNSALLAVTPGTVAQWGAITAAFELGPGDWESILRFEKWHGIRMSAAV